MTIRSVASPLLLLAACSGAGASVQKTGPTYLQFAFFHFQDERVRLTVDGRTMFDRTITVAPENRASGVADMWNMEVPRCFTMVVSGRRRQVAKRVCLGTRTRSIAIDGSPPLTITAKNTFEGDD